MPRARGEADKLGNYYESIWTADSLLDLLSGDAISLTPEPFDETEAEGIEFVKSLATSVSEYHSVKRQKVGIAWSLADLARKKSNGRSPLGDIFAKLTAHPAAHALFVSQTGANELLELCDRARRCATLADWKSQLKETKHVAEDHEKYILPLCENQLEVALHRLKRLRVVSFEEQELLKRVSQKIALWIYRPDGNEVNADDVRLQLVEFVINRLGQTIRKPQVMAELLQHGFDLRIWAKDSSLMVRITELNENYLGSIRHQFVNGKAIPRAEATKAVERLLEINGPKGQLIVGAAGLGKSCVTAEAVELLLAAGTPVLCLRLDNLPHILTTRKLGQELGLPGSPAVILAGIANGGRCVLVIDQLDALSLVSGRNDHLWPVFRQLLEEANRLPNMRLLLACRAFDLHHDQRLRNLTGDGKLAASIELSPLDAAEVRTALHFAEVDPQQLEPKQIELLRTPFNLQLFLEAEPSNQATFKSAKDLFDRFWDRKAALIMPKLKDGRAWDECISTLAHELSTGASSAPMDVLDRHGEDAKILASHGVFVLENRRWRFFHETFGDYAFARQFARKGRNLVTFLTVEGGEQHLYRRSQARQILAYERDRDRVMYVRALRSVIGDTKVRLHIKKLVFEWLSQLNDPGQDEWQVAEGFLQDEILGPHALAVLWERVPWFDLLQQLGSWPKLLAEERQHVGDQCTRMLASESMMRKRSAIIAGLFAPYVQDISKWKRRLTTLFHYGGVERSREMFNLVLNCMDQGLFDTLDPHDLLLHNLFENRPDYAAEFIGRYLDRLCVLARQQDQTNPFSDERVNRSIRDAYIKSAAEKAPLAFIRQVAPRLEKLIVANALPPQDGEVRDKIWRYLTFGAEHDMDDALLFSTARALHKIAATDGSALEEVTKDWARLPHRTIRFLLLRAWAGNGVAFAEEAATYLITNPAALTFGYGFVVGAEGYARAAVSRGLLVAIGPHCGNQTHLHLEAAILALHREGEGNEAAGQRFMELALLRCLPPERLGMESRERVAALEEEFPQAAFTQPRATGFGFVQRALPGVDFAALTDEQWLDLFKRYNDENAEWQQAGRRVEISDVIGPLQAHARADRKRFAALTSKMGDDILPVYFITILQAIGMDADTTPGVDQLSQLDTETLCKVIFRLHSLPGRPCGQVICSVLYRIADRKLPADLVDMVSYYALDDISSAAEEGELAGKELVNYAINTARGSAADLIAKLLFTDIGLAGRFLPLIEKLASDPSRSIRAVIICSLMALLNRDRDTAVRLFRTICDNDERIWASHYVEDFLFHATFTHYAALQSLLRRMLNATDEDAKAVAARQICLAGFRHSEAEEDSALALAGDKVCRRAAAQIYADNHLHPSIRLKCESQLLPLLSDSDSDVRRMAEYWLTNLKIVIAGGDWSFFGQYLETKAFAEEPGICLHELQEVALIPKEITLRVATRAIELSKRDLNTEPAKAYRFASYTPTLVVRLYHQIADGPTKTQCLDLLDSMLALGWNEASVEMAKSEH